MSKVQPTRTNLTQLSLCEVSERIRRREVSPVTVTQACLAEIDRRNPELNAFLTVTADAALEQAAAMEQELAAGRWRGPLHGVPVGIKDLIQTAGVRTTGGSELLRDWVPERDATVVRHLKEAGAVILGKTQTHEFAFGPTSENPHHGPSRNPHDPARMTGGSSGGSAAAVTAGLCYAALGTDTGGSIRIPAALCGIVGLKPTYGRVSRSGVLPLAWSLDHVGPLTRTVTDAALMLEALAGSNPDDATCARRPVPPYRRDLSLAAANDLRGVRIGVPQGYFWSPADPGVVQNVQAAIEHLRELGAEVREVSLPCLEWIGIPQAVIVHAEALAYHRPHLARSADRYGSETRLRLAQGFFYSATDYLQARRAQQAARREFLRCLEAVDVLVTPTVPMTAPLIGQRTLRVERVTAPTNNYLLRNTLPFNLTGLPALSVPCGPVNGLPTGIQIAGRPWEESMVLQVGAALESRVCSAGQSGQGER